MDVIRQAEQAATKQDLQAVLRQMRADLERLVAQAGPARMEQPGMTDEGWSFKDVVGHLSGWRWWSVARMEACARDQPPVEPLGIRFQLEDDEGAVDQLNQQIYGHYHGQPVDEVLGDSGATFDRLEDALLAVPDADLFASDRFPWMHGYRAADIVRGSAGHLYEDHVPGIEAFLGR